MKTGQNIRLSILLFLIGLQVVAPAQQTRKCGTSNYLRHQLEKDSSLKTRMEHHELLIDQWIERGVKEKSVISIPVVFHVVWSLNIHNVSNAQIYSQLNVLNQDYRRQNADAANTPSIFKSVATDTEIEFCLAQRDPDGNLHSGITRTHSQIAVFNMATDNAKFSAKGGHDAWDSKRYLNIWIVPAIKDGRETGFLGYAQPPGGDPLTDGVVIAYNYFGTIETVQPPYNKGRTSTHEIGHWLGLHHIWGDDGGGCTGSDHVDDTPNQGDFHSDCPEHPSKSCGNNGDMFMNYMDYSDDACMNLFTQGQKNRMHAAISTSRKELLASDKCLVGISTKTAKRSYFRLYPNPAKELVHLEWNISINESEGIYIKVMDLSGKLITQKQLPGNQNKTEINTSDFKNGIYIIQIQTDTYLGIEKLLIQN